MHAETLEIPPRSAARRTHNFQKLTPRQTPRRVRRPGALRLHVHGRGLRPGDAVLLDEPLVSRVHLGDDAALLKLRAVREARHATPSSRCRADGVGVDAMLMKAPRNLSSAQAARTTSATSGSSSSAPLRAPRSPRRTTRSSTPCRTRRPRTSRPRRTAPTPT